MNKLLVSAFVLLAAYMWTCNADVDSGTFRTGNAIRLSTGAVTRRRYVVELSSGKCFLSFVIYFLIHFCKIHTYIHTYWI